MSTPMKWGMATLVLSGAAQLSRIWLHGEVALWVQGLLFVGAFGAGITAFTLWFRETQR